MSEPVIKLRGSIGIRDGAPSNKPGTCLNCGTNLPRPKSQYLYEVHGLARGAYSDNAFCTMRCGYAFGVKMAAAGYRLVPEKHLKRVSKALESKS